MPNTTISPSFKGPVIILYGKDSTSRALCTAVSLICISLLMGMLGYRGRHFDVKKIRKLSFTQTLVIIIFFLAISFVFSAATIASGLGLSSSRICQAATAMCLGFYFSNKLALYVFLVERAHVLRAPFVGRARDWMWVLGMLAIVCGFGGIVLYAFLWPIAHPLEHDGQCWIGVPINVTIPLLSVDVVINVFLTGVFVWLTIPLLESGKDRSQDCPFRKAVRRLMTRWIKHQRLDEPSVNERFVESVEELIWKTLAGCFLVMMPTVANTAVALALRGREPGWICMTICTIHVTWVACIIHWLTISGDTEQSPRARSVRESGNNTSNIVRTPTLSTSGASTCILF
ncbi:hypothetical protein B0J11DRAFT_437291 [Dendryphion nanum]|uniref:Uncharacterized protein n=1 Tax=Dendryphion nanum TaxID=256645 RepID=A0A9P9IJE9_9PLEO|nr:hypothetical protein B0J11DRAFT_437291 [Dendryphion nanum]